MLKDKREKFQSLNILHYHRRHYILLVCTISISFLLFSCPAEICEAEQPILQKDYQLPPPPELAGDLALCSDQSPMGGKTTTLLSNHGHDIFIGESSVFLPSREEIHAHLHSKKGLCLLLLSSHGHDSILGLRRRGKRKRLNMGEVHAQMHPKLEDRLSRHRHYRWSSESLASKGGGSCTSALKTQIRV